MLDINNKKYSLFYFVVISLLGIHSVSALTINQTAFTPTALDEFGSNAVTCTHTASLDKSSYSPGSTMQITAQTDCVAGTDITSWNAGIALNGSAASPVFDSTTFGSAFTLTAINDPSGPPLLTAGSNFGVVSVTVPNNIGAGSHYFAGRFSIVGTGYHLITKSNVSMNPATTIGNLAFTVVSIPAPVVNLFFSQ